MALHELDTGLTSTTEAKAYLLEGGNQNDPLLESLIPRASALISEYCGRKFETATHTHYLDGDGRPVVRTPHWPITAVTSLHLDSTHEFAAASLLTEETMSTASVSGDFIIGDREEDKGAITYVLGRWPVGNRNIKIVYTAGYTLIEIPKAVKYAANRLVATMYQIATKKAHLRTAESVQPGGGSSSWEELTSIAPDIQDSLKGYRAHLVGVI